MPAQPPTRRYVLTMALITFVVVFVILGLAAGTAGGWPWYAWLPLSVAAGLLMGTIAYQVWRSSQQGD